MGRKLEKANVSLEAAEQTVSEWQGKADELGAALAEAEATVGAAVLESGDLEGSTQHIADLRRQVDAAHSTVAAAEAARDAAKRDVMEAEAAFYRSETKRFGSQADKHAAKTRELLDALQEHEGGPYVPDQPQPGVIGGPPGWLPRSTALRAQADGALRKAEAIEKKLQGETQSKHREPASA